MREEILAKICLCGDPAVGKTSLIRKYVTNVYGDEYISTLGTKVTKKKISVEYPEVDLQLGIKFTIWDIMGQKEFRQILTTSYFYGAKGVLTVFDRTRKETFKGLDDWISAVQKVAGDVPIVILGNKTDLKDSIQVKDSELEDYANKLNSVHFLTSAKTGLNVESAFLKLGELIGKPRTLGFRK